MIEVNRVKKARKDFPVHGIKKGDSYFQWQHYRQSIQRSLTMPTMSQLTQDRFMKGYYLLKETVPVLNDLHIDTIDLRLDQIQNLIKKMQAVINRKQILRDIAKEKRGRLDPKDPARLAWLESFSKQIEVVRSDIHDLECYDNEDMSIDIYTILEQLDWDLPWQ